MSEECSKGACASQPVVKVQEKSFLEAKAENLEASVKELRAGTYQLMITNEELAARVVELEQKAEELQASMPKKANKKKVVTKAEKEAAKEEINE